MKFTNTLIALMFGLAVSNCSFSQQEPRAAFFWNQYMHTNPAMTGAVYKHHANAQWRNQWTKVNGAPTTLWANYAVKSDSINSGIGASYEYNVIGLNRSHTALLSYAYHLPLKNMFLSFGVSAGTCSMLINTKGFVFSEPNDPALPKDRTYFQGDLGIALHGERWNVGLSSTQLSGYFIRKEKNSYNPTPHYWLFGDYTFKLGERWKLTPRAQVFTDVQKVASTLALVAAVDEDIWFGLSSCLASGGVSVSPMVGYDVVGKFRIGYIYEYAINSTFGSTHEIILSYQLK